ncbi:lipopolysaccharide biosynthesis protein [Labilibacter marinus]|uniref:lipopolysaccharide biosynthesis protein n=1 Tax=Labilibacter marinus TaxID=1477105 RepID=UPI0008341458|nr:oligosaccharide flippase family protein [Labilibacter marinus]
MSDVFNRFRSTVIQSFFYSVGNLFGKFSGVILLPIYLLYLPVDEFGLFALFEGIFTLFQVFSGLGVKLGFARWFWDEKNTPNKKSLFFTTFVFNAIICIILSVVMYFGFDILSQYYFKTEISQHLILLFIAGNLIKLFTEVPMLLLRSQHKAKKHSVIQIAQLVSFVLFVYVFLAWFKLEIEGIFWATILSAALQLVLLLPVIIKNSEAKIEGKILKDIIKYGFPVALGNMVNVLFNFTDKYFINIFSNLKNVGNFSLAHKISNIVNLLVVNAFINAYMHSYFKSADSQDSEHFFSKSFTYFLLVISFCSLLVVLFIEEAFMLFDTGNSGYDSAVVIVPVLTIGLIFGGIRQMLILPINKVKKTRIIGILSIVAGFINVTLNYLFIPQWHALGAAYATGIVQILSSLVLLYFCIKYTTLQLEWRRLFILSISFIAAVTPMYLYQFENILSNILFKIVLIIVWVFIIYSSGFLSDIEQDRISSFWSKWKHISQLKNNINSLSDKEK